MAALKLYCKQAVAANDTEYKVFKANCGVDNNFGKGGIRAVAPLKFVLGSVFLKKIPENLICLKKIVVPLQKRKFGKQKKTTRLT